jgi:hypothetical protein
LPSGPVVIPAGSAREPPNSVIVPPDGAAEGALDGRGDAEGAGLGAEDGADDGLAVGAAVDGALPPPRIGATAVPLLPHPQRMPRTTITNPAW